MSYEDMQKLKKGDSVKVLASGRWLTGEIVGSQAGAEPSIFVDQGNGKSTKVYTGGNFTESAWNSFKHYVVIQFADEEREQLSMESVKS